MMQKIFQNRKKFLFIVSKNHDETYSPVDFLWNKTKEKNPQ